MKVAVLWTHLSGYLNACLRELAEIKDVQLFVSNFAAHSVAPFKSDQFAWLTSHYEWQNHIDRLLLKNALREYKPDVILVSSWNTPEYRYILRRFSGNALRVLAMDNQWLGTFKQRIGVLVSRWYLHPLFDAVFLPGERQAQFAKKLGFLEKQTLRGLWSCDHEKFASVYQERKEKRKEMPAGFICIGRLSPEKGIQTLKKGYQYYRSLSRRPWPLICCGTGPMEHLLQGVDGMILKGFVQPEDLPNEIKKASCLVASSYFEPWPLVMHEATSAGLAVICTSSCGASVHLVQDGYNGYIVGAGEAEDIGEAMLRYTRLSDDEKREMSVNSYNLSLQFTPKRWATYFYERVQELLKHHRY